MAETMVQRKVHPGKEVILGILAKAADDQKFFARLTENPAKVLQQYDLTAEEGTALATADLPKIESWVGKLDRRLSTWILCRLQHEEWSQW